MNEIFGKPHDFTFKCGRDKSPSLVEWHQATQPSHLTSLAMQLVAWMWLITQAIVEVYSICNTIFRGKFQLTTHLKDIIFKLKVAAFTVSFSTFVSQYLIMLQHYGSPCSKGNFTLFSMVGITQNLFLWQIETFSKRMTSM